MRICAPTPYNNIIAANDQAYIKGGRKPCYSVSLETLDLGKMMKAWHLWVSFTAEYEYNDSI